MCTGMDLFLKNLVYFLYKNVHEYKIIGEGCCTLLHDIIRWYRLISLNKVMPRINYILNNGYISSGTFSFITSSPKILAPMINKFRGLVKYLTNISLNRFTKFYNIEKYYDMVATMLLILKAQQRVPSAIIKHLIIPFIYQ